MHKPWKFYGLQYLLQNNTVQQLKPSSLVTSPNCLSRSVLSGDKSGQAEWHV